jgi:hypothetical protein
MIEEIIFTCVDSILFKKPKVGKKPKEYEDYIKQKTPRNPDVFVTCQR